MSEVDRLSKLARSIAAHILSIERVSLLVSTVYHGLSATPGSDAFERADEAATMLRNDYAESPIPLVDEQKGGSLDRYTAEAWKAMHDCARYKKDKLLKEQHADIDVLHTQFEKLVVDLESARRWIDGMYYMYGLMQRQISRVAVNNVVPSVDV